MKTFNGLDEFEQAVGTHLGYSDWHTITQEQMNLLAEATDDHQWIQTDPETAAATLVGQIYTAEGLAMGVNYGSNKVRFPAPVPVGSRVRAGAELLGLTRDPRGAQATVRITIEREGGDKPACVAETVSVLVA